MDEWMDRFSLANEYASWMTGSPAPQLIFSMEGISSQVQNPREPPAMWEFPTVKSYQLNH